MRTIFSIVFLLISISSFNQSKMAVYDSFIKKADSLYESKNFKEASQNYTKAFQSNAYKGYLHDRFKAARAYAQAKTPDSSFLYFNRIYIRTQFDDYKQLLDDVNLVPLHKDPRWADIIKKFKERKELIEINFVKPLIRELDSMVTVEQKWRNLLTQHFNKQAEGLKFVAEEIRKNIMLSDSLNHKRLTAIFNQYGFPNYSIVGEDGSNNFWLLIQHQDKYPEFQNAVLEKMKVEVDKKLASPINYAYLIDRVRVNTGGKQVYGTQMILKQDSSTYEPREVEEPNKLNERRQSVGLDTIEDYIELMNSRYHGTLRKKK